MKAILIDTTRCVGCRGCQVSCKQWHENPGETTTFFSGSGYQNPADLSASTYTLVTYNEVETRKRLDWVFAKKQCFHCLEPGCATVCPVGALHKTELGPVTYDASICLGCRYCQLACPFKVPRFEWDKAFPAITKCNMCADRVAAGQAPACVKTCPTGSLVFGEREDLIREAERRISNNPSGYVRHIYGNKEVGGTSVLYISNTPFEKLGFDTTLPNTAIAANVKPALKPIPFVLSGLGLALGAAAWITNRRDEVRQSKESEGGAS